MPKSNYGSVNLNQIAAGEITLSKKKYNGKIVATDCWRLNKLHQNRTES